MRGPRAELILKESFQLREDLFAEVVIWRVPELVRGSTHFFKYRLALVENAVCLVRYDNEAGKGDHRHIGDDEAGHVFAGLDALQSDFWAEIEQRLKR